MMVSLDKTTFQPLQYSRIFHFQHIGIEFCVGFAERDDEFVFWISKKDRDPVMVKIGREHIPLCFDF
jgi:uncharacterized metal-binding protein